MVFVAIAFSLLTVASAEAMTVRQLARAKALYEQTWGRANPHLGGSRISPLVQWRALRADRPTTNYVARGEGGISTLYAAPTLTRALGRKIKKKPRGDRFSRRRTRVKNRLRRASAEAAKGTLLHEWAHVYQDPTTEWAGPDAQKLMEGGADLFKKNTGARIGLGAGWDVNYYPDDHQAAFIAKFGPDAWRREQFGQRWGKDPRTLRTEWMPPAARTGGRRFRRLERNLDTRKGLRRARRALRRR